MAKVLLTPMTHNELYMIQYKSMGLKSQEPALPSLATYFALNQ